MRRLDNEHGLASLSANEILQFRSLGYLVYPEFFPQSQCKSFCRALRQLSAYSRNSKSVVPHPAFNELISHPAIITIAKSILGDRFLFHHANGRELDTLDTSKSWHHDYDGARNGNAREGSMIHLMCYPSGLSPESAPLVILPKSHLVSVDRSYPCQFGISVLPNEVNLTGEPGLLVVIDSALWHARRGTAAQRRRTYFNFSYCRAGLSRPERASYSHIIQSLRTTADGVVRMLMRPERR